MSFAPFYLVPTFFCKLISPLDNISIKKQQTNNSFLINLLFVYLNQLNLWLVSVSLVCAASFWKLFLASSSTLAIESQRGEEEKRIRSAKWSRDGWQWWLFTTAMFNKNNSRTLVFRSTYHLSDLITRTVNFRIQI